MTAVSQSVDIFFRALGNSLKISEKKNISEIIIFVETLKS